MNILMGHFVETLRERVPKIEQQLADLIAEVLALRAERKGASVKPRVKRPYNRRNQTIQVADGAPTYHLPPQVD